MTLIQCDLYTTFCFTWGWPWRNVAGHIYMSAIISASNLCFFPLHMSFSVTFACKIFLPLFCPPKSALVTQQREARVNQAGPFSFVGPWLVLMMFPKRWRGRLRGHSSCSALFTACRFMSPPPTLTLSYHIFNIINIDRAVHLEPLFNNCLPWLIQAVMVSLADREGGRVWFKTVWKIYVISHE